jgi:hypothetical protein
MVGDPEVIRMGTEHISIHKSPGSRQLSFLARPGNASRRSSKARRRLTLW